MKRKNPRVIETKGGYLSLGDPDLVLPVKPPRKPIDAERSALPPAYWKDRTKKRDRD
jgi:hypothetical protein